MAKRYVYLGSTGPFIYDDTDTFKDGTQHRGIDADQGRIGGLLIDLVTAIFSGIDVSLDDNDAVVYGTDDDFATYFNGTNLITVHDYGGANTTMWTLNSSGDLAVTGAVTGSNLNISNWDAAYTHISSTGADHSYINQDVTTTGTPTFASVTATGNVTGANLNISNWDTAFGWGNHATQGYLTTVDISANTNLSASNGVSLTGDALSLDSTYSPSFVGGTFTGNVGVGGSRTEGKLHVIEGSAGAVTASTVADIAVFESSGLGGISILTPGTTSDAFIAFGSPASNLAGLIVYRHDDTMISFGANGGEGAFFKDVSGLMRLGIEDSTPSYSLDVNGDGRFVNDLYANADFYVGDQIISATYAGNILDLTTITGVAIYSEENFNVVADGNIDFNIDNDSSSTSAYFRVTRDAGATGIFIAYETGQIQVAALGSDPTLNLADGQIYYNTTSNKFRGRAGGSWTDLH